jgi:protein-S-isoprenylcysteine O-methyltransferase Ste14
MADMDSVSSPPPATLKVPLHPAILLGFFLLLGWGLRQLAPRSFGMDGPGFQALPGAFILAACALGAWCIWTFKRHGNSPEYGKQIQALHATGPYRFSRNPLFITNALLYTGVALLLDNVWALCLMPVLVLALDRLVITREERYLADRFGETYLDYCRCVRRWF